MTKVMTKDCIKAALEYNKGMISIERFCSILGEYDESHKLVMLYDMDKDNESMVTKLYLIDTNNHYRTVRTVWSAVEEENVTAQDVIEIVEQFNDGMIEFADLYDMMNKYDRQHDSKIDVRFIEEHKVGQIFLVIGNGLIKRIIWDIKGKDLEKQFKRYAINHVKNLPTVVKESRVIRVEKDLTIRVTYLLCGYWAYERLGINGTPVNTIVLNTDGKTLTKPRLWKVCDFIKDAYGASDTLHIVSDFIKHYNASRRIKLSARLSKGKLIITRHDKDDTNRVVYRG